MANRKRRPSGNPARIASASRTAPGSRSPRSQAAGPQRGGKVPTAAQESALRAWVTEHSRRPVLILARQPKLLMPAVMVALVLAGLAAPVVVAVIALILLSLFVGWLAFLSWPVLSVRGRTLRGVVLFVIVGVAVARITGVLS